MAKRRNPGASVQDPDAAESRAAVAVTVAWMLTCMSTAAGTAVALALRVVMQFAPGGGRQPLASVAGMLLAVAALTGVLCLLFTPLTYRVRQTPPPRSIAIAAVLIGLAPLAIAALVTMGAF
jgi:hypothetical protein